MNEKSVDQLLRESESHLDSETRNQLARAREKARSSAPWYRSTLILKPAFASLAIMALVFTLPGIQDGDPQTVDSSESLEQNLQTMITEPEFFLWLAQQEPLGNS